MSGAAFRFEFCYRKWAALHKMSHGDLLSRRMAVEILIFGILKIWKRHFCDSHFEYPLIFDMVQNDSGEFFLISNFLFLALSSPSITFNCHLQKSMSYCL